MSGFKVGELVLSCSPYAYVLNDDDRGEFCDYCFQKNDGLKKCSQCSYLHYCDKQCQKKAWELHKLECKFLKKAGNNKPPAQVRLNALVFLKVRKYGYNEPFEFVGDKKVSMASLMSHAELIKIGRNQGHRNDKIISGVLTGLESYIGSNYLPSFNESAEIYGKIFTNIFAIHHQMGPDGIGLYLGASVFDHSCDADAAYIFDGTTLNIRMMRSVPHRDIMQIHISYLNELCLKEEKKQKLWESKFFLCNCSICISPKSDELLTKLANEKEETKEKALNCKKDVEELLSNGPSIQEPQLLYGRCKNLLKCQSGVLADTNIYKLRTLQKAFSACLRLNKLNEAVEIAVLLEKPYRMYYRANHPILGYFLYQYGRSLCNLERFQEALPLLSEAEAMLKVTHGEQHAVLKILQVFKVGCLIEQKC